VSRAISTIVRDTSVKSQTIQVGFKSFSTTLPKEPKISMLEKFNGTRLAILSNKLSSFYAYIILVVQMALSKRDL